LSASFAAIEMSMSLHTSIFAAMMLALVAYLAAFAYLLTYLRRVHTATWANIGRPTITMGYWGSTDPLKLARTGILLFRFVFGRQYRDLGDSHLARLIWLIRSCLALGIILFIFIVASTPTVTP
jgi:hypothetical protein